MESALRGQCATLIVNYDRRQMRETKFPFHVCYCFVLYKRIAVWIILKARTCHTHRADKRLQEEHKDLISCEIKICYEL